MKIFWEPLNWREAGLRWWRLKYGMAAWWEYGPKWNWQTARTFLRLARLAAGGKLKIVNSEEVKAQGGYKYLCLTISKMPVSADHSYGDL